MYTYEDIIKLSKPHATGEGRHTLLEFKRVDVSIVGGRKGLYGDFVEYFEIAIFDKETKDFVSNFYFPEHTEPGGDVMPYIQREKMLEIVNFFA